MSEEVRFFVGLHQPSDARHFPLCCISINRLVKRKKPIYDGLPFIQGEVLVDSGAFTTIAKHGGYPEPVDVYADQIRRLIPIVPISAIVAQDYMCEPQMLEKTGLSIPDHQRLTIERYDQLMACGLPVYVMPVLQGYDPEDYVDHLRQYGDRLAPGAWVGVGSVCKRNSNPQAIVGVLQAIKTARPDLRLHGFGIKLTSMQSSLVCNLLHSADSLAWSYAARKQGRNANDWREAARFASRMPGNRIRIPTPPRRQAIARSSIWQ